MKARKVLFILLGVVTAIVVAVVGAFVFKTINPQQAERVSPVAPISPSPSPSPSSASASESPASPSGDSQSDTENTPPPAMPAAPVIEDMGGEFSKSVCHLDGVKKDANSVDLSDVIWLPSQGYLDEYPTSSKYGPGVTDPNGVRTCFQRSPEGAILAAANMSEQFDLANSIEEKMTYGKQVLAGPLRDEVLKKNEDELKKTEPIPDVDIGFSIVGYKINNYDGTTVNIQIGCKAIIGDKVSYFYDSYPLRWVKGDWKIYPASVDDFSKIGDLDSLTGFKSWGALN